MKLVFTFLLSLISITAMGKCDFRLTLPPLSYYVASVNPSLSQSFTVSRGKGGQSCNDFIIGYSRGGSTTYNRMATNSVNGSTISYNLYKTSAAITELRRRSDTTTINQVITGTIDKHETKILNYFFQLGTLGSTVNPRAGTYTDTIQVEVSEDTFLDNSSPEIIQPLSVTIVVPKSIAISLVNTGSTHDSSSASKTLDFGELSENEEQGFDVKVVSNAGYTLSVSSVNNQKLQLEGAPANANGQIAYDFYSNNNLKNLTTSSSSPVNVSTGSGSTPSQGVSVPIRVVIKSVDNKVSGIYKDYVTFTVATTE